jgi:hypothetical protein
MCHICQSVYARGGTTAILFTQEASPTVRLNIAFKVSSSMCSFLLPPPNKDHLPCLSVLAFRGCVLGRFRLSLAVVLGALDCSETWDWASHTDWEDPSPAVSDSVTKVEIESVGFRGFNNGLLLEV